MQEYYSLEKEGEEIYHCATAADVQIFRIRQSFLPQGTTLVRYEISIGTLYLLTSHRRHCLQPTWIQRSQKFTISPYLLVCFIWEIAFCLFCFRPRFHTYLRSCDIVNAEIIHVLPFSFVKKCNGNTLPQVIATARPSFLFLNKQRKMLWKQSVL